jgi:hypothetical protein
MFITVIIAFSWTVRDTRIFYPLLPILTIVSIFPIIKFVEKFNHKKILIIFIIGIILLSSISYLEIQNSDLNHQREANSIAQHVVSIASGINNYYPEDSYIAPSEISDEWPVIKNMINFKTNVISTDGFDSLEKYIESARKQGLTHIIIDNKIERPNFLKNVFENEEQYPYLLKVFDSKTQGFTYKIKIFKIDYNLLN